VLFDMDGTLTEPMLDFPLIKREMGIDGRPFLEALAEMTAEARARAEAVLHRHEDAAAVGSILAPGCREVLAWLRERSIGVALVTRNSRRSVETVLSRHSLSIDVLITRENGEFKPSPAPVLAACRRLNVAPAQAWMVGDGEHDITAGNAAGVPTVWLSLGRPRRFSDAPWTTVANLVELQQLLERLRVGTVQNGQRRVSSLLFAGSEPELSRMSFDLFLEAFRDGKAVVANASAASAVLNRYQYTKDPYGYWITLEDGYCLEFYARGLDGKEAFNGAMAALRRVISPAIGDFVFDFARAAGCVVSPAMEPPCVLVPDESLLAHLPGDQQTRALIVKNGDELVSAIGGGFKAFVAF
jgi:HAD superfamily hydrolase (TIGR01509 family)